LVSTKVAAIGAPFLARKEKQANSLQMASDAGVGGSTKNGAIRERERELAIRTRKPNKWPTGILEAGRMEHIRA
jgi:hypothetical protein